MLISEIYSRYLSCSEVITDTRKLRKNSMFFALKGPHFNANEFAAKALEEGCKYVVIDEKDFYIDARTILVENVLQCLQDLALHHRKQLDIPVIGITGSNGKTTTKELMHAVLSEKYNTFATQGNFNNHIGVPLTLLAITSEVEIAIVEMGANHAGEIAFLCDICLPNYGVITNIGKAHLEGFGTIETIIETKTALYRHLQKNNGLAFVNQKDQLLVSLSENNRRSFYRSESSLEGEITKSNMPYLSFELIEKSEAKGEIVLQLIGDYNLDNVLAAMAIGDHFKVPLKSMKKGLEAYTPSNNRSQLVKTKNNQLILDAYNANPTSTLLAIKNFKKLESGNKLIILGDMLELGVEASEEHQTIIDELKEDDLELILVGPIYFNCNYPANVTAFKDTSSCHEFISKNPPRNKTILIKGSRGLKLETLTDSL